MARSARVLLYLLLVWAPLPLASNRPVFWVLNGVVASVILALFVLGELRSTHRAEMDWRPIALVLVILAVWSGWMLVQAVPDVPPWLMHPLWRELASDLSGGFNSISVSPGSTWATIAQVVPIVFLGVVAARTAANPQRAGLVLMIVTVTAVAIALYGLGARHLGIKQVFLLAEDPYAGFLTGTFVGRSAAATYFALGLACAAGLLGARIGAERRNGSSGLGRVIRLARRGAPAAVGIAILAIALFNTGSRAGAIAGAVGFVAAMALSVRGPGASARAILVAVGGAIVAVAVAAMISGGRLADRLAAGINSEDRLLAYRDTLDMAAARPLSGHGAGTFSDAFPMYHLRAPFEWLWSRAHNTYLQAAAELGLPMTAVILAGLLFVVAYMLRASARSAIPAPAAVAAVSAAMAVAVQSLVDFSVQIQAVGLTFVVLLGTGLGQAASLRPRAAGAGRPSGQSGPGARTLETVYFDVTGPKAGAPAGMDPSRARVPDGARVYVFGDLHGRLDLLDRAVAAIAADRASAGGDATLVGLGDYIDRGPDSRQVIDRLIENPLGMSTVYLRGNHEQALLDFIERPAETGPMWFRFGAEATLLSYGVDFPLSVSRRTPGDYQAIRDALAEKVPPAHLAFLHRLPTHAAIGDYFFAHAGARPGRPLDGQRDADLLWIREGFADRDVAFEKVVVHGHTPVDEPYLGKHRINLDTGAYTSNRLSVLVLEGGGRRLLAV